VIRRGGQTNALAFVRDITDRKLAEASLQESELFSREIQRIARLGGWKANPHTDYLKWTEGVYDIVEAPRNYMPNLSEGIKYFQPEYIPLINESLSRCLSTGEPFMIECEIMTATGRRQWTEVRGLAPVVEGERSSVMGTFQDITDRKEAGKKLRESEELFRLLFNAINDAVFLHYGPGPDGLPGRFIEVNNIACERLGYSRDELLGMSPVDIDAPDTVASIPPIMEKLNKEKQAIWEGVHIARNGRRIPVEINNQLIDFKGIPAVLSTARDITDRKRIESQLIQAQKLEAIGTLAGGMAHNFNNILMGIQGYASLMLMSLKEDHPHYDRLKNIEEQIKSGAGLTQQLLGFARGGKYETKSLDINQVLSQSAALFGKARKEIVMHMSLMEGALIVLADQNQMEQVFLNLFMNASQSMPKGGNIHLETKKMFLGEADMYPYEFASGEYVQITVKDTGMGMDEKTRKRIFEPFFTTKRAGEGTGLGLSTVYGIIKGHRGFITVQSEVGSGTSFAIYLPASGQGPVKKKIVLPETLKGTETILLVDDEKAVLEVNKEFLESLGYRVYGTGSGQEAMAVYMEKQNDIDLVILDMIMPGISGGETFDRLREINSAVRVLLSSGYSINGDAQQILERGCNGFIQKPFHLEKLSQKVREILD
jgi:PAS domain S-box-containing protein